MYVLFKSLDSCVTFRLGDMICRSGTLLQRRIEKKFKPLKTNA